MSRQTERDTQAHEDLSMYMCDSVCLPLRREIDREAGILTDRQSDRRRGKQVDRKMCRNDAHSQAGRRLEETWPQKAVAMNRNEKRKPINVSVIRRI